MKKYLPDLKNTGPLQQGVFIMLLITALSLGCLLFRPQGMFAWNLISSPLLLFCFYNPIIGAFRQKPLRYFGISALVFILLGMYIYISGNFISDFNYQDSGELQMMTLLIITFFLLFNLICLLFRGILNLLHEIDR
ncbi:MAG: hypothetical protein U0X41_12365 [Chitinophagales bacterium]